MAKTETPEAPVTNDKGLQQRLYNEALRSLRDNHADEFVGLVKALYTANGLEYKPRLSVEQKAAQEIEKLLSLHPALAAQYAVVDPTVVAADQVVTG